MLMLLRVIGWAICVLGFGGVIAVIIVTHVAQTHVRERIIADVRTRKRVYKRVEEDGVEYFKLVKEDEEAERR